MPKLPVITSKECVAVIERAGFVRHHQVGSHAQFKHPDGRRLTIPIHAGKELSPKTLKNIIVDAGLSVDEFVASLRNKQPV
jgi:predicted RNA binding protein YcfA (HicA-like mRNA interferase family)